MARSTPIPAETTPTKRVWQNPDGSRTAQLSASPVRFKGTDGIWRDFDFSLSPTPNGRLAAKASPDSVQFGAVADGTLAELPTAAGTIKLRHPGAQRGTLKVDGPRATYSNALSGGRDVVLEATPGGFKETVILPEAGAPGSYIEMFDLPESIQASVGSAGIEFKDTSGSLLATYGGGIAHDAASSITPVSVELVRQVGSSATVRVSVSDNWLAAPERVYPVAIDPDLLRQTCAGCGGRSNQLISGANADKAFPAFPYVVVGTNDNDVTRYRSLMWFDVKPDTLPAGWFLQASYLWLAEPGVGTSCEPQGVYLFPLSAPFTNLTTWNEQPPPDQSAAWTSASWRTAYSTSGTSCAGPAWQAVPATDMTRDWLRNTKPNNGVSLVAAAELSGGPVTNDSYKGFYGEPWGSCCAPTLWLKYLNATIQVDPNVVMEGNAYIGSASGAGFSPDSAYDLYWVNPDGGSDFLRSVTTDTNGQFTNVRYQLNSVGPPNSPGFVHALYQVLALIRMPAWQPLSSKFTQLSTHL